MTEELSTSSRKWLVRAECVIPGTRHLSGLALAIPERSPMYIEPGRDGQISRSMGKSTSSS
jgi:hypothetical protein